MGEQDESKLIALVRKIINGQVDDETELRNTYYPNYEDYYAGRQIETSTTDARSEQKAFNVCRSKVNAVAAICTDRQPRVEVVPRSGQDPARAATASLVMDWLGDLSRLNDRIGVAHHESVKMGTSWEEALWLPGPDGMGGRPWGVLYSPRYVAADQASSPEEMRWVFAWRWTSKGDIKRLYPTFDTSKSDHHIGLTDDTVTGVDDEDVTGKVLLVRGYMRSSAFYYDDKWPQDQIPFGQMSRVVIGGKQLLENVVIGADTDDIPMVPFRFQPEANCIDGTSLLHDLMDIQDEINNLMFIMTQTCKKDGMSWTEMRRNVYERLADKYTNEMGLVIPVNNPGQDMIVHQGIGFPPEMLALLHQLESFADRVTLFRDISEAIGPSSRISGKGIRAAQEVNLSALRRTIREYESSIRRLLMIHFKNFVQHGGYAQIPVPAQQAADMALATGGQAPPQNMGAFTVVPVSAEDLEGGWDVKVVVSPAPPSGWASYREQVLAELQTGVRDLPSALQALEIPDWREILQRKQQEQELQMQMMMMQGGASPRGSKGQ